MALPEPAPGLVVRYDYLWHREAAAGQDHGKDRPTCLVAASDATVAAKFVVLLPITHSSHVGETQGIEISARVRKSIGLDDAPAWVIVSEYNVDEWPNPGLSPIPGRKGEFTYGFLPPRLFGQIKRRFLELAEEGRAPKVER